MMSRLFRRIARPALCLPILLLAVFWSGTVSRPATLCLAFLCAFIGFVLSLSRKRIPVTWFSVAFLLLCGAMALQCIPLQASLRQFFGIEAEPTLRLVLSDIQIYPAQWLAFSLDPAETTNELVRFLSYSCLLGFLPLLRARQGDTLRLVFLIFLTGLLVALLSWMSATGIKLPALFLAPTVGQTRAMWPAVLQNANHMAALLSVSATLCMGLLLDLSNDEKPVLRIFLSISIILIDIALFSTLSRAGILIGIFGQLCVFIYVNAQENFTKKVKWIYLLVAAVLLSVLLFVLNLGGPFLARILDLKQGIVGEESKFSIIRAAWPLFQGHAWFGIGRGAMETAIQVPESIAVQVRFTHLENEWLQLFLDFGVPVTILFCGIVCLAMFQSWKEVKQEKSLIKYAAFVCLCQLAIHNCFDFNLSTGALAVFSIVLIAVVQKPLRSLSSLWMSPLCVFVMFFSIWVWYRFPSHEEDGETLKKLAADPAVSVDSLLDEARKCLQRHPLDSYLSALVAARLVSEDHPQAMLWINRALNQNKNDMLANASAATLLCKHGHKKQGLWMLGPMISRADAEKRIWLFDRLVNCTKNPEELIDSLQNSEIVHISFLEYLGTHLQKDHMLLQKVSALLAGRGIAGAWIWFARSSLALSDPEASEACLAILASKSEEDTLLLSGLIGVLIRHGNAQSALRYSEEALGKKRAPELYLAHAETLLALGQLERAKQAIADGLASTSERYLLARLHEVAANVEERLGNIHRAANERALARELLQ